MMIYDVRRRRMIADYPSGPIGSVSFERLATEVLRAAGELRAGEEVTHLIVDIGGLRFRTETQGSEHGR